MNVARLLFVLSIASVSFGVGAFNWRLGLVAGGSMLWWSIHRPRAGAPR